MLCHNDESQSSGISLHPPSPFNTHTRHQGGAALDPALTANVQLAVAFVSENMPDLDARFKRDMMVRPMLLQLS